MSSGEATRVRRNVSSPRGITESLTVGGTITATPREIHLQSKRHPSSPISMLGGSRQGLAGKINIEIRVWVSRGGCTATAHVVQTFWADCGNDISVNGQDFGSVVCGSVGIEISLHARVHEMSSPW